MSKCCICAKYLGLEKVGVGKRSWCVDCVERRKTYPRTRRKAARPKYGACRHCHRCVATRPRGLCWPCYENHTIRATYPPLGKYGNKGNGNDPAKAIPEPTNALPGTPEKILVLQGRARRGEALWHPDDARRDSA